MREAGYKVQGAPVLTIAPCTIMGDDAMCVSLTGCRCKNTKGQPMPVFVSIYAAIGIYEQKKCPICRDVLKEFVFSAVESRQSIREPNELPSNAQFNFLVERAKKFCQGYAFSGLKELSEESKDALSALSVFFRKNQEIENDEPIRAGAAGGAEAQARAIQIRAAAEAQAIERRMRDLAEAQAHAIQIRAAAEAQAIERRMRAVGEEPYPVPQMRAGGGAAAPVRRHQYDSDSDSDGGYSYIRRHGS